MSRSGGADTFAKTRETVTTAKMNFEGNFSSMFENVVSCYKELGTLGDKAECLQNAVEEAIVVSKRCEHFECAIREAESQYNAHRSTPDTSSTAAGGGASSSSSVAGVNDLPDFTPSSDILRDQMLSAPSIRGNLSPNDVKDHNLSRNLFPIIRVRRKEGSGDSDDDVELEEEIISTKCAITGQTMTNPMRSRICGHVFSEAGWMSLFGRKREIKCPQGGCGTSNVTKEDLVPDKKRERYVQSQTKSAGASQSQRGTKRIRHE
mgnify:CR=1 FL=1|jgi:hypothetical protein